MQWADILCALDQGLAEKNFPIESISTDSRTVQAGDLFLALKGPSFDGHAFITIAEKKGASALIVSEPVETTLPCIQVEDTLKAYGDIAHFWRTQRWDGTLIGITGSMGKTTVKHMLSAILLQSTQAYSSPKNFNNAIGLPYSLLSLQPAHTHAVIEMGTSAPGEIGYLTKIAKPTIGIVTTCAPVHLEFYKDGIDGIAHEKSALYRGLPADGIAILNIEDTYADSWRKDIGARPCWTYGLSSKADVYATDIHEEIKHSTCLLHINGEELPLLVPLPGHHNVLNALGAAAIACALGCSAAEIIKGLGHLTAVPGRLRFCQGLEGASIIDDSYSANPQAVLAAIKILAKLSGQKILVLGDMGELGEHSEQYHRCAGKQAQVAGIERLLTFGEMSRFSAQEFGQGAQAYSTQAELLEDLRPLLVEGTACLVKGSNSMNMAKIVEAIVEG